MSTYVQGSLFEKGYLLRTLGAIAHEPDIALTELVANCWDAGAAAVHITVPDSIGGDLRVRDDGLGMLTDEFTRRWMKLGYDRQEHQGKSADFPPERAGWKRIAYGRNGVGRHGLLCFADDYQVLTTKADQTSWFHVSTATEDDPFVILAQKVTAGEGHGTELVTTTTRHLPDATKLRQILASRFIHDPQFAIFVNGIALTRTELAGNKASEASIVLPCGITVAVTCYDTNKAATNTLRQGVAFWVGGRLVGEPSWTMGRHAPVDGRTHFGKRYTFIVECDDMRDQVEPDWTGFKRGPKVEELYVGVAEQVEKVFREISASRIEDTKETVYRQNAPKLQALSSGARREVACIVERVAEQNPGMSTEVLESFVSAMVIEKQSSSMQSVLQKLTTLSETDIAGLDRFLSEWDIKDALTVLDEVDNRLAIIEAIKRLSGDKKADELHSLHPLVAEARWVVGPEFDTPEYSSNQTIRNAVQKVFGKKCSPGAFENARKRSDLLVLRDSTLSAVGLEVLDPESQLVRTRDVLLIELKRGGFSIGREEMNQADGYVQDIFGSGQFTDNVRICAFVVGHEVDAKAAPKKTVGDYATIRATTFGALVDTAARRLFGLKQRLNERYGELQRESMPPSLLRALSHHQPELPLGTPVPESAAAPVAAAVPDPANVPAEIPAPAPRLAAKPHQTRRQHPLLPPGTFPP